MSPLDSVVSFFIRFLHWHAWELHMYMSKHVVHMQQHILNYNKFVLFLKKSV